MAVYKTIIRAVNPYVGYRIGGTYLAGLDQYAAAVKRHVKDKVRSELKAHSIRLTNIKLPKDAKIYSKLRPDFPEIIMSGLFPEAVSTDQIKFVIRALNRGGLAENRIHEFGDIRLQIVKGKCRIWITQERLVFWGPIDRYLQAAGFTEFTSFFSPLELKTIFFPLIDLSKFGYKQLTDAYPDSTKSSLIQAFESVGILVHVYNTTYSAEVLSVAKKDPEAFKQYLVRRGDNFAGNNTGLLDSYPRFLELNDLAEELKVERSFYRLFLVSLWLHDIGKIIGEKYHPAFSGEIIRTNSELRQELLSMFSSEEISYIEFLVEHHSLISDTAIMKEKRIFSVVDKVRSIPGSRPIKEKLLKALFLLSFCDVDAYNRLSSEKIEAMFSLYNLMSESLIRDQMNAPFDHDALSDHRWGEVRFADWVTGDDPQGRPAELALASDELSRALSAAHLKDEFFRELGRIEFVSLIYDLRREITDPRIRTRLVIWLVNFMGKCKREGFDLIELCITRSDKDVLRQEVEYLSRLLAEKPADEVGGFLDITYEPQRRSVFVYFRPR